MAIVRITDLRLRTIIGIHDWERKHKQDIVINISMDYDAGPSSESDDIKDTVDYKAITKDIIREVEASHFFLLEKLTKMILNIVTQNGLVKKATVRVDKPHALRFADSVSVELSTPR